MLEERLSKYLHDYKVLGSEEARELEQLVSKYPWFNGGHILLAKAHKNQNRYSFRNLLKKASLHAGDRSELFEVMHDRWMPLEQYLQVKSENRSTEIPTLPLREVTNELTDDEGLAEIDAPEEGLNELEEAPDFEDVLINSENEVSDVNGADTEELLTDVGEMDGSTSEIETAALEKGDDEREVAEDDPFEADEQLEQDETAKLAQQEEALTEASHDIVDHPVIEHEESEELVSPDPIIFENPNTDEPIPAPESTRTDLDDVIKYDPIEALKPLIGLDDNNTRSDKGNTIRVTPVYDPERELLKLIPHEEESVEKTKPSAKTTEPHDFTFWLDHLSDEKDADTAEIDEEPVAEKTAVTKEPEDAADLLEKFIKKRPSIRRMEREFFSPEKQSQRSIEDSSDIVSESLAKLYLKQGFPEKAVEVFNKLRLQNPQKDAYFARLIQEIKP